MGERSDVVVTHDKLDNHMTVSDDEVDDNMAVSDGRVDIKGSSSTVT